MRSATLYPLVRSRTGLGSVERMRALLRSLWLGEMPLARAFWEFAILYGFVLNLLTTIGSLMVFAAKAPDAYGLGLFLLAVPYNLFVMVAVWRSAGRYRGARHWADFARIAVVVWVLAVSLA